MTAPPLDFHITVEVNDFALYALPVGSFGELYSIASFEHQGCVEGEFCRNPLHPGPCKGWKHMLHSVSPGTYHALEQARVAKLEEKRKAKIQALKDLGKPVPKHLLKPITYAQVPKKPEGIGYVAPTKKEAEALLPPTKKEIEAKLDLKHAAEKAAQAKPTKFLQKVDKVGQQQDQRLALDNIAQALGNVGLTPQADQHMQKIQAELKPGQALTDHPLISNTIGKLADKAFAHGTGTNKADIAAQIKDHIEQGKKGLPPAVQAAADHMGTVKAEAEKTGKSVEAAKHVDAVQGIVSALGLHNGSDAAKASVATAIGQAINVAKQKDIKISEVPGMGAMINHFADKTHAALGGGKPGKPEIYDQIKDHIDQGKPGLPEVVQEAAAKLGNVAKSDLSPTAKAKAEKMLAEQKAVPVTPPSLADKMKATTQKSYDKMLSDVQANPGKTAEAKKTDAGVLDMIINSTHSTPEQKAKAAGLKAKLSAPEEPAKPLSESDKIAANLLPKSETPKASSVKTNIVDELTKAGTPAEQVNLVDKLTPEQYQALAPYDKNLIKHVLEGHHEKYPMKTGAIANKLGIELPNAWKAGPVPNGLAESVKKIGTGPSSIHDLSNLENTVTAHGAKAKQLFKDLPEAEQNKVKKLLTENYDASPAKADSIIHHLGISSAEIKGMGPSKPKAGGPALEPQYVKLASDLASGKVHGTSKIKVQAYAKLSKAEFDALPQKHQDKIISDLTEAHGKFLDPAKIAQAKGAFDKFTTPKPVTPSEPKMSPGEVYHHFYKQFTGEEPAVTATAMNKAVKEGMYKPADIADVLTTHLEDQMTNAQAGGPEQKAKILAMAKHQLTQAVESGDVTKAAHTSGVPAVLKSGMSDHGTAMTLKSLVDQAGPTPEAKAAEAAKKVLTPVDHGAAFDHMWESIKGTKGNLGKVINEDLADPDKPNAIKLEHAAYLAGYALANKIDEAGMTPPGMTSNDVEKILSADAAKGIASGKPEDAQLVKMITSTLNDPNVDHATKSGLVLSALQYGALQHGADHAAGAGGSSPSNPTPAAMGGAKLATEYHAAYQAAAKLAGGLGNYNKPADFEQAIKDGKVYEFNQKVAKGVTGLFLSNHPEITSPTMKKAIGTDIEEMISSGKTVPTPGSILDSLVNGSKVASEAADVPSAPQLAEIGKLQGISKIPKSSQQIVFSAFKSLPKGQVLTEPVQDQYDALMSVAAYYGGKKGFPENLSVAQVAKIVDAHLADKLGVSNTHLLEDKIKSWLKTSDGKAYAQKLGHTPPADLIDVLHGGGAEAAAIKLQPGQKVQKLSGPGAFDPSKTADHFKAMSAAEIRKLQQTYMDATGKPWTPAQKEALKTYTSGSYYTLNGYLRGESEGSALTKQQVKEAQAGMRPLQADVLLKRGTGWAQFPEHFRGASTLATMVGKTFTDDGFVSTTIGGESGEFFGAVHMLIEAPAGTPAASVRHISYHPHENEVILAAGTKFRLLSVKTQGSTTVVRVRVVS